MKHQLEELTQKSDAAISVLLNSTVTPDDPFDRTSLQLERDFTLCIMDRENRLILKIKKALEKIEEQNFGICENSCDEIDIERLKLRPVMEFVSAVKSFRKGLRSSRVSEF